MWGQSASGDAKVRPRLRTMDVENATDTPHLPGALHLSASASSPRTLTVPSHGVSARRATEEVFQAILGDVVIAPVYFLHSESCSKPTVASLHCSEKFAGADSCSQPRPMACRCHAAQRTPTFWAQSFPALHSPKGARVQGIPQARPAPSPSPYGIWAHPPFLPSLLVSPLRAQLAFSALA